MDVKYYCMWDEYGMHLALSSSVYAAIQYRRVQGLDTDGNLLPATLRELTLNMTGRALWT